jgi:hypothetical protein
MQGDLLELRKAAREYLGFRPRAKDQALCRTAAQKIMLGTVCRFEIGSHTQAGGAGVGLEFY